MRAVVLLAALLALAFASPASAAEAKKPWPIPKIGIGEQNPEMFASPYFKALKVQRWRSESQAVTTRTCTRRATRA